MTTSTTKKNWCLKPNSELRFEIQHDQKRVLTLKLLEGTAEIFGVELVKNRPSQAMQQGHPQHQKIIAAVNIW